MRLRSSLPCLTLILLASCGAGSKDPAAAADAGYRALGAGDFATAQTEFEAALGAIGGDTSNPVYFRARLGSIEAACRTDPDRAKRELLDLAQEMPGKVDDRTFSMIAGRLGSAGSFDEAIALLEAGKKTHPGSELLDALGKKLREDAEKAGDSSALDALSGLGYTGD